MTKNISIIAPKFSKVLLSALSVLALPVLAIAEETSKTPPSELQNLLIQFGVIFFIFYFLLIRPQQKKYKQQIQMTNQLKKGDKVITNSGIMATVSKAVDGEKIIEVEIAKDVKIQILRASVTEVLDKAALTKKSEDKKSKDKKAE